MQVLDLPDEILIRIRSHLPVRDVCRTFLVCKKLNHLDLKGAHLWNRIRFHKKSNDVKKWFVGVIEAMQVHEEAYHADCEGHNTYHVPTDVRAHMKALHRMLDAETALDISTPLFDLHVDLTDMLDVEDHETLLIDTFVLGVFGRYAHSMRVRYP